MVNAMAEQKTPEQEARELIDAQLAESGWVVQSRDGINLSAGQGVAIREFPLKSGHGFADYLLFIDGQAVGVLEAKKVGFPLTGVEVQAQRYSEGLPDHLDAPYRPLPFCYLSTGAVTMFSNGFDPHPRSRRIFQFHRPTTLAEWLRMDTLDAWVRSTLPDGGFFTGADDTKPSSLRSRLQTLPPLQPSFLYPNQIKAVTNLDQSLKEDRPRALIQMATGSGKTIMAVTAIYRLIKFGGARRVLFLVDRGNLGEQAEKEFANFRSPDDNRKFTELYNVQRLASNNIGASSKVVISTIQRLYSMLKGEEELDPTAEETSLFELEAAVPKEPLPVVYNPAIPPEHFDVIVVDECHRSIYSLWRQVLEYFDAYLIGLTATPAKHTFGFFNQNLVMEYGHEEAVADGVNVDFELYRIRTRITADGSTIEAEDGTMVGIRDRQTRQTRWEQPDEDVIYDADELDRRVVAKDQIRLIVQTFKQRLPIDIFPGRREAPKTLIFAKDDSHAEDIVEIVRQEFGKGNDFCQKITYKTTGRKPADLIQDFRNSYQPRIAVTVDMIATGTDIKPIEVVMFMRAVKSRVLFEQMKGRGVRVIDRNDLKAVTPDTEAKTHFVIVDCVGITETEIADTQPLERKKSVSFKALLEHVALGGTDPDFLSSLASRLARLDKQCGEEERRRIAEVSGGVDIGSVSHAIVKALDPDEQIRKARLDNDLPPEAQPDPKQIRAAEKKLLSAAAAPLATNPQLRNLLVEIKQSFEQIIDEVSKDALTFAGYSEEARDKARELVTSFEKFLADNKDEIDALQFFYSQPYSERLHYRDIKELHDAIKAPPRSWTEERLWAAYQAIERNKVRGASAGRRLTDIVSLIRFALHQEKELVPYADQVRQRFESWLAQQENAGRRFTGEQKRWLEMIRDHVALSLEIDLEDFTLTPFVEEGGIGKARKVFGTDLARLIDELNKVLAA
ncbi:MAG TPA: type I restriction-modification enzyme R subunit C-terminal domain-containing protein [Thermoanaerobaculales bacterium]|nr:type I restriction-modification enzyme R subunit C-terminal domain-containing protein [Thermoanaerobaculales bacterium]